MSRDVWVKLSVAEVKFTEWTKGGEQHLAYLGPRGPRTAAVAGEQLIRKLCRFNHFRRARQSCCDFRFSISGSHGEPRLMIGAFWDMTDRGFIGISVGLHCGQIWTGSNQSVI